MSEESSVEILIDGQAVAKAVAQSISNRGGSRMSTNDLTIDYIERRAKFKKRAEYNLNVKILDGFKQLRRCANAGRYAYDEQAVEKILLELKNGVADVERAFRESGGEGVRRWVEL